MKSVMEHSFANVPKVEIPRSSFNRSHGYKTTFDADSLVPVYLDDCVPGDTFNMNMHYFARLATPLYPLMDNLYFESFWFFIPYRLVWTNWEKMHGAQDNPADSIDFTVPVLSGSTSDWSQTGYTLNYFGIPNNVILNDENISALPMRAMNLVFNEWFRDENLQDSLDVQMGNGPDPAITHYNYITLKRGKRHDYFTSCLPWPQKGDAVALPLGTSAQLSIDVTGAGTEIGIRDSGGSLVRMGSSAANVTSGTVGAGTELLADLSNATAATINDLRLAFQTQRLLERDARSGTRYNELILSHFGVTVPDFRVQRPEFLGGGSDAINISPVAQTSGQATPVEDDKLGGLAAFGTVSGKHGFTKSFVEHGMVLGLVNVRGDITYSQGVERYWSKQTRYDFYYPVLSQIGEQAVLNKEIYIDGTSTDDDVFGYQERYAEYRYKPSRLTGLMSPLAAGTLAAWNLGEEFLTRPALGSTFIESNTQTPLDRALAIPTEPQFILDCYMDLQCARPMPLYGVPGNLDRF